jgi:hypothetical protein
MRFKNYLNAQQKEWKPFNDALNKSDYKLAKELISNMKDDDNVVMAKRMLKTRKV